jgi:hypothetical protein
MTSPITCLACQTTGAPAAAIAGLVVCAACGASLVVDASGIRRATAADTTALSAADLHGLRLARGKIARAAR